MGFLPQAYVAVPGRRHSRRIDAHQKLRPVERLHRIWEATHQWDAEAVANAFDDGQHRHKGR